MAVVFNPLTPENRLDPYPHYHELRREDPIQRLEALSVFVLTRYADVAGVLRDPRFSVDRTRSKLFQSPLSPMRLFGERFRSMFLGMMLMRDPPDHTRLRNLVNKAFTPRVVEKLAPRIQAIVDELLDAALERGEFDLVKDFAFPLPVTVIAEMLGVEGGDRDRLPALVAGAGRPHRAHRAAQPGGARRGGRAAWARCAASSTAWWPSGGRVRARTWSARWCGPRSRATVSTRTSCSR